MLADYHVHTEFSDDSVYPLENVVKDVVGLGLDEICITDHVDYGVKVGWDSGLPASMPSAELLRMYRDLGGSIVTIGSDSYAPAHLGAYIQEAKEHLKGLGFRDFCTYEKLRPIFHRL